MKVPKGSHRMPDGSIMKNSAMRKRKTKKRKTRKKQKKHRIKKHGNLIPRKRARKRRRNPPPMNWGHGVIPPDTTNLNAGGGAIYSGPSLAHSFNLASSTFAGPKSIDANFNVSKMGTATVAGENADATRRLAQSARDTELQMLHRRLETERATLSALTRQAHATASLGGTSLNESVSSTGTVVTPAPFRPDTSGFWEAQINSSPKHPRRDEFLARGRRAAVRRNASDAAKKISERGELNLAAARQRVVRRRLLTTLN